MNSKGLGNLVNLRYLKELTKLEEINMLYTQETKLSKINKQKCYQLWEDNDIDFVHSEALNGYGGILIVWHSSSIQCSRHISSKHFVIVFGKCLDKNIPVVILNVYLSCNIKDKISLWMELEKLRENETCKSWCILGDFNTIKKKEERRRDIRFQ